MHRSWISEAAISIGQNAYSRNQIFDKRVRDEDQDQNQNQDRADGSGGLSPSLSESLIGFELGLKPQELDDSEVTRRQDVTWWMGAWGLVREPFHFRYPDSERRVLSQPT